VLQFDAIWQAEDTDRASHVLLETVSSDGHCHFLALIRKAPQPQLLLQSVA
jgi:hypothetical protein